MKKFAFTFALTCASLIAGCGNQQSSEETDGTPLGIAVANGLQYTIKSVQNVEEVGERRTFTAGSNETFVVVRYAVKNTSDQSVDGYDIPKLVLRDHKGRTHELDQILTIWGSDEQAKDLNPDNSEDRTDIWRVAADTYNPATWQVVAETKPELAFKIK